MLSQAVFRIKTPSNEVFQKPIISLSELFFLIACIWNSEYIKILVKSLLRFCMVIADISVIPFRFFKVIF